MYKKILKDSVEGDSFFFCSFSWIIPDGEFSRFIELDGLTCFAEEGLKKGKVDWTFSCTGALVSSRCGLSVGLGLFSSWA